MLAEVLQNPILLTAARFVWDCSGRPSCCARGQSGHVVVAEESIGSRARNGFGSSGRCRLSVCRPSARRLRSPTDRENGHVEDPPPVHRPTLRHRSVLRNADAPSKLPFLLELHALPHSTSFSAGLRSPLMLHPALFLRQLPSRTPLVPIALFGGGLPGSKIPRAPTGGVLPGLLPLGVCVELMIAGLRLLLRLRQLQLLLLLVVVVVIRLVVEMRREPQFASGHLTVECRSTLLHLTAPNRPVDSRGEERSTRRRSEAERSARLTWDSGFGGASGCLLFATAVAHVHTEQTIQIAKRDGAHTIA